MSRILELFVGPVRGSRTVCSSKEPVDDGRWMMKLVPLPRREDTSIDPP
jgi:hypothetical protein